ncbi:MULTISPECIES: hypothetical protein [unclassified Streptomyces]|uniref:hypothetical protein n=1 Tax=unclassified Streptomyces TaxID=2593676 RepID=UPI0006FE31C7|nr:MULTISPECIES: hypothetical protein [unclassified Streptomyces]KQX59076.1 hypothetical protein ASD33_01875 [Streptomyces sp. Root1304]KRB00338.1 hypothetical protein ASE09_01875 [Streptomyces sp. Root66D1]
MSKFGTSIAALGLAVAGLVAPATAAQASGTGAASNHCNDIWPGRNGNVYAYNDTYCYGYLGSTAGNDADWNASGNGFTDAGDKASSVMNAGTLGGKDVVAFYYLSNYSGGYGCLAPGEFFVDDLSRPANNFTNGRNMNNQIRSHQWVYRNACTDDSMMG